MSKTSLADAMNKVAGRTSQPGRIQPSPTFAMPAAREKNNSAKSQRTKGRIGKKVISGFFDPEVSKQLARLGIDKDRSMEDLLGEALNDLFAKYQLPPIA